jgi:hypothetical protein
MAITFTRERPDTADAQALIAELEALHLYERIGFRRIPPFGEYKEDPSSLFYEVSIDP